MPAPEREEVQPPVPASPQRARPAAVASGLSVHDLLASCAAATAVSTPPGSARRPPSAAAIADP
ncbi:hypothetical protein ACM614_03735, partial [Streptomyces sp. 12297]